MKEKERNRHRQWISLMLAHFKTTSGGNREGLILLFQRKGGQHREGRREGGREGEREGGRDIRWITEKENLSPGLQALSCD
jgi:hypothetical protein